MNPPVGQRAQKVQYRGGATSNGMDFFRGEVALAYQRSYETWPFEEFGSVPFSSDDFYLPTTSYATTFKNKVVSVAIAGLCGCTSAVVISRRGVWVIRLFELPSFLGAMLEAPYLYQEWNSATNSYEIKQSLPVFEDDEQKEARFQREVINAIHRGQFTHYHQYGLDDLRGGPLLDIDRIFDDENDPGVYIFSPRPRADLTRRNRDEQQNWGQLLFAARVEEMRIEFGRILGVRTPVRVVDYYPLITPLFWPNNEDQDAVIAYERDYSGNTVFGKVLIQYEPAQDCHGEASWHLYWEGIEISSKSWVPLAWPTEVQVAGNYNNQRRDNGTFCEISSSSSSASVSSTSVPVSSTTTPTTTPTPIPTTVPVSPASCYNSQKFSCYQDVDPATAYSQSDNFCSDLTSMTWFNGPNEPAIQFVQYASNDFSGSISYNWMFSWKPGCVMDGQAISNAASSCKDAMRTAFEGCDNGGHGGTVEFECWVFYFSPVNQGSDICSVPFS
ncbi:hypothetical protein GGR54DRAFT_606115 [Hypoxylon sp. NC1633]|nr:hypothetical protein GGR54DRAFT_606115 [Hypoxylon sp. NC1633]